MLSAVCLLVASVTQEVPRLDLLCRLVPAESRLSIQCSVEIPRSYVKAGKAEFELGEQLSVPKIVSGGVALEPKKVSQVDRDVTYSITIPENASPVKLEFSYDSVATKGMVFYLSPQTCFGGGYNTAWYPAFGGTRRAMGTIKFQTPKEFLVKASGREVNSVVTGETRSTEFRIEDPIVPTFASAAYHVVRVEGKVPVTCYFLTPRPELAQTFAEGCSKILKVLEKEFGPYPFPDFSIVETPSPISSAELGFSGASFEGCMFADTFSVDTGFNLAYFGHEMGHQYWGNLVQTDGKVGESIFSEGLAQYGGLKCVEAIDGAEMAKQFRIEGYPGFSDWQCTLGALAFINGGYDRSLSFEEKGYSPIQHDLACTKGFLVYETMARAIGKENFRAGLRQISKDYRWKSLTWDQTWKVLQTKTKIDLKPYRDQWFEKPGIPTTWTEWSQDGSDLKVVLRQSELVYRLQMPPVVRFKDGSILKKEVELNTASKAMRLNVRKDVLSVALDPDHETFHSTPELNDKMLAWKDYAMLDYLRSKVRNPPNEEKLALDALTRLPSPDKYGVEFLVRFTLAGVYRRTNKHVEAREQLEKALACPVRKEDFVPLAFLRLARANEALGKKEEIPSNLASMVSAESKLRFPTGVLPRAKQLFPDYKF